MNTIRGRILIAFLVLFLLIGPFIFFAFNSLKKIDNAKSLRESVAVFDANRLKADNEFFNILDFDTKVDSFYVEKSTSAVRRYHQYIENSKNALGEVELAKSSSEVSIDNQLKKISKDLDDLNSKIIHVFGLVQQQGFRNFGTIGKMRQYVHKLESDAKDVSLAEILQMRRREKDFFLRNDYKYVEELNTHTNEILNRLTSNPNADKNTLEQLRGYQENFNLVVHLKREIGDADSGMIHEIKTINTNLNAKINRLYQTVDQDSERMIGSLRSYLAVFLAITLIFAILSAFVFSGYIARPIKKLVNDMDSIAQNNFEGQIEFNKDSKTARFDEIDKLTSTYNGLVDKIRKQIKSLNEKNQSLSNLNGLLVESENELKEASRIKDKFFSIISHDLRGHAGNVLSLAKLLKEDNGELADDEKGIFIKYISDASQNLQLLLDNLLNWAKTQMNDHNISKRMFNINNTIEKNVGLFRENALRKNIAIQHTVKELPHVYADKNMIDFVVRNLLSNALKFTRAGDTITIDVVENEQHLEVRVKDTGVGMTQHQREALLKSTKDNATTRGTDNEQGTGLGFAICKDFILRNNGSIQIESEVDKGSVFSFTVPTNLNKDSILKVS
ncbi:MULTISPECIES: HAMP domain-containing sensor histidine kinase [Flavobacteriaceae]|uniref:HAMP domain-containing sensor histidine kinase n=1 Tax=Flavobacteriaceae TaxID=49546 RepID=UPI001492D9FE|nr:MULTISPECIES: HAMP domain-containing sensor histidine kinase [Allomuricauda]MDC6364785.1 ATP-binding protein [Muricauda sp. AC10]